MLAAALAGCVRGRGPASAGTAETAETAAPVRLASHAIPSVPARRTSTLLNFESPADLTFVAASPANSVALDRTVARDGGSSLALSPQAREVTFKLPALLAGREFPGDWTLAGAYFYADSPAYVTAIYELPGRPVASRTIALPARAWVPVMVDLGGTGADVGSLRFQFVPAPGGTIRCDDLVLIDNNDALVDAACENGGGHWSVARRGLNYLVERTGGASPFKYALLSAEAQQGGWRIAEAGTARARFEAGPKPSTFTVYADGRAYVDGAFRPMTAGLPDARELAAQAASPADVHVAAGTGIVRRNTPGDADNDGYNESCGAYQLAAAGPRLEFTLAPQTPVLVRPVVEIADLPPGPVLITMEGQLVEISKRMSNGNVLVELPARIERPTLVNVRVK
jgi:hypothetical protein